MAQFFFILFILFVLGVWHLRKQERRIHRASTIYWDMDKKIDELFEDPFMTEAKWKEWLPIFEVAEAEYRLLEPTLPHSLVARVRRIIEGDEEEVEA